MSPANAVIKVENLTKKYQQLIAVNGISFEVYEGEVFGLLGPNGAGKTTTLEIMETLREQTSGKVFIHGLDTTSHSNEIKQLIGVQLQAANYYPSLTLLELIDLFAGLYNQSPNPEELLKMVALYK